VTTQLQLTNISYHKVKLEVHVRLSIRSNYLECTQRVPILQLWLKICPILYQ